MDTRIKKYLPYAAAGAGALGLLIVVLILVPKMNVIDTEATVTDLGDGWSRYTDPQYGFSIEFPSAHGERPFIETHSPGNYPDFYHIKFQANLDDMNAFSVSVIPTGFADAEAWFIDRQKDNGEYNEYVLERTLNIGGEQTFVTYWRETPENELPPESRERRTALSRDGIVYVINTRGMVMADVERVWNSFQFLDDDLVDGRQVWWLGVFHDSPIVNGLKSYHSEQFGISFNYPDNYLLFENYFSATDIYRISISPEVSVREAMGRISHGGHSASILFTFHRKPASMTLEEWLLAHRGLSNYSPDDPSTALTPTTVDGVPALKYHTDRGLAYASDYVAFFHKEWVVVGVVYDMGEKWHRDFETIVSSIQLK